MFAPREIRDPDQSRVNLAAVCNEDRTRILERAFFTPQHYQDGALHGFRE
jgi:hypothetical protein